MRIDKDIITSRQNRDIVEALKLCDRKGREKSGLFRFDGAKLLFEAASTGVCIERVFVREDVLYEFEKRFCDILPDCRVTSVSESVFEKLSEEKSPEGIICVAKHLDNFRKIVTINKSEPFFAKSGRVFLVESVRDPGNIGTLVRSANALGCDRMIISADCADIYNPKALRASMGAAFCLEIGTVLSIPDAICALRENGRRVFAAALDENAAKLGSLELFESDCFIVGNEGHGLTQKTVEACTQSVFIPMKEGAESLNAAAAAVILLWEQARLFGC